ncbi:MAG: response regulator transcription factor [Saprospiraceae bacterium]|nr:response regulator transcription factor [Saprospiraceae bacterium]
MDFRITIVDDEPAARDALRNLLRANCPDTVVSGEAGSVAEAERLLREHKTDLLLLDVEMEDGTGFDLLDQLGELRYNVIFTTAHDDFAIRAFRYNAIDYLLKPIDPDELITAVQKARQNNNYTLQQRQIANLVSTASNKLFDRIILNTTDGPVFAKTNDITRIESYGNYTFVFLAGGERCLVSRNLKEFEEMLPAPLFFRLHQSHLINMAFVKKFLKEDGGHAVMSDGAKIPVARRKKDAFLEALMN